MKQTPSDVQQIWQRVHPTEAGEQLTLHMLLRQLAADTACLNRLLSGAPQSEQPLLRQLIAGYTDQLHCLRGILILSTGSAPTAAGISSPGGCLRRCCSNALSRLDAYRLRSADPLYGAAFGCLAQQTQEHYCKLLRLLGSDIKEPKKSGR